MAESRKSAGASPAAASEPTAERTHPETAETSVAEPSASIIEPAKVKPSAPTGNSPVDLAAILRKTGFQIDLDDEPKETEEPPRRRPLPKVEAHEERLAERHAERPAVKPAVDISGPVPRVRKTVEPVEEVSIDDYMSNLLARARGDSAPTSDPKANVPKPQTAVAPAPARGRCPLLANPRRSPQLPCRPHPERWHREQPRGRSTCVRRRQLANMSAKSALQRPDETIRLAGSTRAKLLVTIVAGVVAHRSWLSVSCLTHIRLRFMRAVAAFAVAALWGLNYLTLMSKIAGERFAYMSRHLKTGEEAAAEVKPTRTRPT